MLIPSLASCASPDDGPRQAAERFLAEFADGDSNGAAALTSAPDRAQPLLEDTWEGLDAQGLNAEAGRVRIDGDVATVDVDYRWDLGGDREWRYPATVTLSQGDRGWQVRWSSTGIHPELGADQRLVLRPLGAARATVNESDGSPVMTDRTLIGISFDGARAAEAGPVIDAAERLVAALAPFDDSLSAQAITESATAVDHPIGVTRLTEEQFDRMRDLLVIPGVVTNQQADLAAADPNFAPALLTKVKQTVEADVNGEAGWQVAVINPNGLVADVLADSDPTPAPSVTLTLSRTVQNAAQRAVNGIGGRQVAMVVVQASTGRILAVAQNPAADRDGLIATTGLYPPGSTFKIVTAAAAMNRDVTPSQIVPCPGEIQIGSRLIPNYARFSLGPVPLHTAFANSCNTSFAHLAGDMGPSDLANAAAAMGLGPSYDIPGLDAVSGSVPIEPDLVGRAVDGFGQGRVLVSPLGLALVAATAASGHTPVPTLIEGRETRVDGPQITELDPAVYEQLRPMMRAVVTEGTATMINGQGAVFGKTGEAEINGGSHAWFAGFRGDLAFATLMVLGGDSTNSVNVTRDFFNFLPAGYGEHPAH